MVDDKYPLYQGPDPAPTKPAFDLPNGTIDTHAHIFGTDDEYPFSPTRGYTPPEAPLESYLQLHKALGGIDRAVLTQPSVYGTDNACMLNAVSKLKGKFRAVIAIDSTVTDAQLQQFHKQGARGVRVNMVDKGGNPFDGPRAVQKLTDRIKDLGWHLEVLVNVHKFDDLRATMNAMSVDVSFGHLGYMKTDNPIEHPGFQELLNLLRDGNSWVKLTGSYRITTSTSTPYNDVTPYAQAIIEANEDRVVWGTDWPHPVFKGTMPNDGALLDQLSAWAPSESQRTKILVENPKALYGFD